MGMSEAPFFSELLQRFRKRKRLNQKQLAERIEVSRETISLWERGEYQPESDRILYKIVDVLGLTTQEQQQLFEAFTVTARVTSFHNPPLERNLYFTGRGSQLSKLHTLLKTEKQVALTQAISGLGGIGKTQLALEYAYRFQKSYHDIFWVTASTYDSLITSYVRLAAILNLPGYDEQDQSKVKVAVQRWLGGHKGWLLILDNVEDLRLVHQFVPIDRQGAVLLTTRRRVTEQVAQALELELLPENDAMVFLLKRTKVLALDKSLEDISDYDIEAARAITQILGNLPLALDQAGAYILETQCSLADYLALFKAYQAQLLQRRIGEGIPTDHPESVTTTFKLNFQQIQQQNELAGELLRVSAFLASEGIGEEIFMKGASKLGSILQSLSSDRLLLNQAIEVLCTFSLIRRDSKEKTFSIHCLVQAVLQEELEEAEKHSWAERAMLAVNAIFPQPQHGTWPQCERLLSHALLAVQFIEKYQMSSPEAGKLLYQTAWYLRERARYQEAESIFLRALNIQEQTLGLEHPDVAISLNGLVSVYYDQGKYAEAEPFCKRALHIWEQQPESGHSQTQMTNPLANLALIYFAQGKYAQAELLNQRALHIWEQQLGPDHPQLTLPLNNLALIYIEQGRYTEAEPLYQRALHIREQRLGPDHPLVASPLNGLAILYSAQGKYAEAEPLCQRALRIGEQQLGSDHPSVAYSLNNLANVYGEQGRYTEAEPLYQRALHIREQRLGPDHPQVTYPLIGLADLYFVQGKYAEAESLYQRTLHIEEQQSGHNPLQRVHSLTGLANVYFEQGKYTKAEVLYQQALRIREQPPGLEHPEIAYSLFGLANLRSAQGKYGEAESLYRQALHIWEQLGPEHPDLAYPISGLATLYRDQSKYAEAEPLYQRALHIREQTLGFVHPVIARIMDGFARLREAQGNSANARALYARALVVYEKTLGMHHPKTNETRQRLIALLYTMEQHEEAAQLEAIQAEHRTSEEDQESHPEE